MASLALAVLTLVSFRLHAGPAMAALLFFFLVILISLWAGFLSTALACAVAALCFVYFFTQPLYHLWMSEPVEIAATMAFSSTALIISRLLARVRERTAEVQRTNEQLQAEIAERRRAEEKLRQSESFSNSSTRFPSKSLYSMRLSPLFANRRDWNTRPYSREAQGGLQRYNGYDYGNSRTIQKSTASSGTEQVRKLPKSGWIYNRS